MYTKINSIDINDRQELVIKVDETEIKFNARQTNLLYQLLDMHRQCHNKKVTINNEFVSYRDIVNKKLQQINEEESVVCDYNVRLKELEIEVQRIVDNITRYV